MSREEAKSLKQTFEEHDVCPLFSSNPQDMENWHKRYEAWLESKVMCQNDSKAEETTFYCKEWDKVGFICEEQCDICRRAISFEPPSQNKNITAEEYLAKNGMSNVGHYGLLTTDPSKSKMHQIMEDYACKKAMAFSEWKERNGWWLSTDRRFPSTLGRYTKNINGNVPIEQTHTLYSLYVQFLEDNKSL